MPAGVRQSEPWERKLRPQTGHEARYSLPIADSHGVWFAGSYSSNGTNATGVALYVPGSGFYWMSSIGGQLAGGCH